MKRILIFWLLLYAASAHAQTTAAPSLYRYCTLQAFANQAGKASITLDVGSGGTEIGITAEKRENINKMKSMMDALNLLSTDGWEVSNYSVMQAGMGQALYSYLLRRRAQ
ncbi:hypothetical protein GCM10028822_00050 [Hymenobacter terrigena]